MIGRGSEKEEAQKAAIDFVRVQLDTIDAATDSLDTMREMLVDQYDHLIVGKCAECDVELFIGDKGHRCVDNDPLFCSLHAYTWADVKESYECEDGIKTTDPEAYAAFIRDMEAHVASGGKVEDPILHDL